MLTINTLIPTSARIAIRSLVKGHSDWPAFLVEKGIISANARKADIIEFALRYPVLVSQIESILALAPSDADGADESQTFDAANVLATIEANDVAQKADMAAANNTGATFDLDGLLAGVDQLLSPLVRKEIVAALAPVIDAANKPAIEVERIVEVERLVEVAPGEAPRPSTTPKARRANKTTLRTLFPSKAKETWNDTPLTQWAGVVAPPVDPHYVMDRYQIAMLMTAWEGGENCWLVGPSGVGKSTLPYFAAGVLGRPFVSIGMTRQTEVESLVGGMALRNGSTVWEDGALVWAMRQPGMVILIDELTFAPPGVQAIVQHAAGDQRSVSLPTGETVRCADGVVFVIADNTNGAGDEGGLYAGTHVSNAALVTRFARMIHIDYLPAAREAEAVANHTGCPIAAARHLANFVAQARAVPALQGVIISIRQMVAFVRVVQSGFTAKEAFATAISTRMPATERATLETMADLAWSSSFEALVHGKPMPTGPSASAAAQAFPDTF